MTFTMCSVLYDVLIILLCLCYCNYRYELIHQHSPLQLTHYRPLNVNQPRLITLTNA